ncbi:MAG: EAL domain-containing protein [Rhizobiaceae bacterium]|nr:EAL domain-containing protein [Rhizobiaceae bacterium]
MTTASIFNNLIRGEDGAWSTVYGPFVLRCALQPVFRRLSPKVLDIHSFQGLVRAERNGEPFAPAHFFPLVEPNDLPEIESLLRTIHILNAGLLHRKRAMALVSFNPALYPDPTRLRVEFDRIRLAAHSAGMETDRIICDISGASGIELPRLTRHVERLREAGFRVSLTDHGAGDTDIERVRTLQPDFVRLDGDWVRDYMHNSAGFALLRVVVRQLSEHGTETILERLEEMWQVDLCEELGVSLMQGYALARPEIAPTNFNAEYPEIILPLAERDVDLPIAAQSAPPTAGHAAVKTPSQRAAPVFGKRRS